MSKTPIRLIFFLIVNFLILLQASSLLAQTLSGQVLDDKTKEPIPFANIYFNNSYTGTTSGVDGYFKLDISKNPGQDIIISSVGYHSSVLSEYSSNNSYKIYLKQKVIQLSEVIVSAKGSLSRDDRLKMFRKEFLGNNKNAKSCVIENEDNLELIYSESEETLEVFSNKPLIIINKALGNKIKYYLEEFILAKGNLKYQGSAQFQEMNLSPTKQKKVAKKRRDSYIGSRMEFFRLLWTNKLKKANIQVYDLNTNSEINLYNYVITDQSELKYLDYSNPLAIHNRYLISFLFFPGNTKTLFTADGFFDPEGLSWEGKMSEKRIGDQLPYEYSPDY